MAAKNIVPDTKCIQEKGFGKRMKENTTVTIFRDEVTITHTTEPNSFTSVRTTVVPKYERTENIFSVKTRTGQERYA